jgi:hypothetical protein
LQLARLHAKAGEPDAARRALQDALAAAPLLRDRAASDPLLAPLVAVPAAR